MSEYYPSEEVNYFKSGAFDAASSHWSEYFRSPEGDRFGDEHTWDAIVTNAIAEIGIPTRDAMQLNEIAKLEAQFTDYKL